MTQRIPRPPNKKLTRIFRVNAEDDVAINDNIKKYGFASASAYLRHMAVHGPTAPVLSAGPDPALIALLTDIGLKLERIGRNINQMAYKANAFGRIEEAAVLEADLAENNVTRARLDATLLNLLQHEA